MPLHVRRSSDPALLTINGPFGSGDPRVQTEEQPSRKNPTRWSTTAGFLKARHSSGTNSLERKVRWRLNKRKSCKKAYRIPNKRDDRKMEQKAPLDRQRWHRKSFIDMFCRAKPWTHIAVCHGMQVRGPIRGSSRERRLARRSAPITQWWTVGWRGRNR